MIGKIKNFIEIEGNLIRRGAIISLHEFDIQPFTDEKRIRTSVLLSSGTELLIDRSVNWVIDRINSQGEEC